MITITLRPLHLAIAGGFLAGIVVAAVLVLGLGGGDSEQPSTANVPATVQPSPTTAPTSTPEPEPTATPTEEPQPSPEPEPTNTPSFRSCDEIRQAGTYNSEAERQFFLDNCIEEPGAGPAPATQEPGSAPSGSATAQEALYRDRAEGSMNVFVAKLTQYYSYPSFGAVGDILDFGALLRRQAQEMDLLPEPPPRFEQVHFQLRSALINWANFMTTVVDLDQTDEDDVLAWVDGYFELGDALVAALEDYALVVGFELPPGLVGE